MRACRAAPHTAPQDSCRALLQQHGDSARVSAGGAGTTQAAVPAQPRLADGADESTAVLTALSFWDYAVAVDAARVGGDAFKATGRCFSVAAGRVSFTFGLRGARVL